MHKAAERIGLRHLICGLGSLLLCACRDAAVQAEQPAPLESDIVAFCAQFRTEAEEISQAEESPSDDRPARGWPITLPGMAPPATSPAPPALIGALLGPSCPGGDDLWAVRSARLIGNLVDVEQEVLAVSAPSVMTLADGRTAFFAIASEGHYHAADGVGLIAIVDGDSSDQTPLFVMPGGGAWGDAGGFNLPREPLGGSQIWSAAGDISFGDAQGWAGVTDLTDQPSILGRFLTYGRHHCAVEDGSADTHCSGAWEYVITSIVHAPDGQLTLHWRMHEFDERPAVGGVQRSHIRTRDLSATYQLRRGRYQHLRGDEPPKLE